MAAHKSRLLFLQTNHQFVYLQILKSNLHYARGITPKRVTSGGGHLCGLAPGLHISEESSQRRQVISDTVPI